MVIASLFSSEIRNKLKVLFHFNAQKIQHPAGTIRAFLFILSHFQLICLYHTYKIAVFLVFNAFTSMYRGSADVTFVYTKMLRPLPFKPEVSLSYKFSQGNFLWRIFLFL